MPLWFLSHICSACFHGDRSHIPWNCCRDSDGSTGSDQAWGGTWIFRQKGYKPESSYPHLPMYPHQGPSSSS